MGLVERVAVLHGRRSAHLPLAIMNEFAATLID
jgi:hypothetical protein